MSQSHTKLGRRHLFAGAGAAGALAAAAVALKPANPEPAASDAKPSKPDEGGGYRVTQHVLRYYETTKV